MTTIHHVCFSSFHLHMQQGFTTNPPHVWQYQRIRKKISKTPCPVAFLFQVERWAVYEKWAASQRLGSAIETIKQEGGKKCQGGGGLALRNHSLTLTAWESPRRRGPLGKDLKGRRQRRGRPHEKRTARRLQERKPEDAEATDRSQQVRSDLHFQAFSLTHKAKDAGSPPGNYRI